MTDICLLGANDVSDLMDLHRNLLRMFNNQQASFLKNEIFAAKKFSGTVGSWVFIQTTVPITKLSRAKGLIISDQISQFFTREFQDTGRFFAVLRIQNNESHDDAITRFFNQATQISFLRTLGTLTIEIDVMYLSGQ